EDDLFSRDVAVEIKGTGADGVPLELIGLLRRLLGHDVTVLVAHHAEEEDGIERLERDLDGVRVHDLDGLDDLEVDAVSRSRSLVDLPLEAELDILRGPPPLPFF